MPEPAPASASAPLASLLERWRPGLFPAEPGRATVPVAARAFATAGLAASDRDGGPLLAVVPTEREAEELAADLRLYWEEALLFPAWETLPLERVSPNASTMARRAQARCALAGEDGGGTVVAASARAVMQRVSPSDPRPLLLVPGREADFEDLVRSLDELGYVRTDRVEARGEFAVRGGILDVFPAGGERPVRADFWGERVEELRVFAVGSQRSVGRVERLEVYPAREFRPDGEVREAARLLTRDQPWAADAWERLASGMRFPGMESWLPWLAPERNALAELSPRGTLLLFDPDGCRRRARELMDEERDLARDLAGTWGGGGPQGNPALFLELRPPDSLRRVWECPALPSAPGQPGLETGTFSASPGQPESVADGLRELLNRGFTTVLAMDGEPAAQRTARILAENGLALPVRERMGAGDGSGVVAAGVHNGMVLPAARLAVLGEREIAGRRRAHRRPGRPRGAGSPGRLYQDLAAGDYAVHHRHGIGRFEGLATRAIGGVERDYIVLGYAGNDKLYVPTDQLAAVKKYTGGESPRVSKMGGGDWAAARRRVKKEASALADHVIEMHRQRALAPGRAFAPDGPWQREMEDAFPFEETPDQLAAAADVKADMESDAPMDRLIFGDVGFGKTEVAIRAVFKAVTDGCQAAVLCPTTLLAQQHHQTFRERFAPYPVRVEMLSRFLTPSQARRVLDGLRTGEVDVVIGTHRLLSDGVTFKHLGLLVVDEEHRFGVAAKEKIKGMRVGVDVLTLTATPIPRTLEMALTGIREVSHIRTPPEDRHPILTYVGPYDPQAAAAAVRRELLREGQVFYVHNRIGTIEHAAARLREAAPEARLAVAHGRMSEGRLEQVMLDFWDGRYDVLVSTTIIESGLDLPAVNTLIVERADLLGLAGLYQLRGRVGRSDRRAYAYLFHPDHLSLPETALRRLAAVGEHTDLGSGLALAQRDLEIRGAGSVLGEVQSGHIAAVGFDMYVELVSEAVAERTGGAGRAPPVREVRIDLGADAHLPAGYVGEESVRLEAYRRLAAADSPAQVEEVADEWRDRYGPLPPPARLLIKTARLRVEALRIGLEQVLAARRELRLGPVELSDSEQVRLQRLSPAGFVKPGPASGVLILPAPQDGGGGGEKTLDYLLRFLPEMWPVADAPDTA